MTAPDIALPDVALVLLYVCVLWIPGAVVGALAGLRGWTLAAVAPLLTYAVAGLSGPWSSGLGVRWSAWILLIASAATAGAVLAVRLLTRTPVRSASHDPTDGWPRRSHYLVGAAVGAAVIVGALAVVGGMRRLSTIPQDWDAAFHANGIRWLAEYGDGGLFAMSQLNWYEPGSRIFYPNAYHLVGSVVYEMTGRDIPSILNAHTALIPGMLALSLVAVVRRFGGTAFFAGMAALLAVGVGAVYDMLWRGPLLPFATGVVLLPVIVVLLRNFLDAPPLRPALLPGLLAALGIAGLACLHPAMLFSAAILAAPFLVQRWWQRPRRLRTEPVALLALALASVGVLAAQIGGALSNGSGFPPADWPAELSRVQAVVEVFTFGHAPAPDPQWLLAVALAVGVLFYRRLGDLQWVGASGVLFAGLFVVAAASDAPWANNLTRPWWNDRWRLAALAAVPLVIVAAHGIAELRRLVAAGILRLGRRQEAPAARNVIPGLTAAAVVVAVVVASGALYLGRNQEKMALNTGNGPAISAQEIEGMQVLGRLVPPGERVMNDRGDGSVWMYALAGVKPVAGHYDESLLGPDAILLAKRFNQYDVDADVRAAADRLGVEYVMISQGFLRSDAVRQPGLLDLDRAGWLQEVYRNPDVVIYRLATAGRTAATAADGYLRR